MAAYREVLPGVTVLPECWPVLVIAGASPEFSARFDAHFGSLPMENLDAEAFRFGGEGRNRAANALFTVKRWLISLGISMKNT